MRKLTFHRELLRNPWFDQLFNITWSILYWKRIDALLRVNVNVLHLEIFKNKILTKLRQTFQFLLHNITVFYRSIWQRKNLQFICMDLLSALRNNIIDINQKNKGPSWEPCGTPDRRAAFSTEMNIFLLIFIRQRLQFQKVFFQEKFMNTREN